MLGNIYHTLKIGKIISQNETVKKLKTDWVNNRVEMNKLRIGRELHQEIIRRRENQARQDALSKDIAKRANAKDISKKPNKSRQSRSR